MSEIFDGPSGTRAHKNEKELRETWEDDKLEKPRSEQDEKVRQERNTKRGEMVGGGDGVRTNDLQKGGWGGAMLGVEHA